MVDPKACLARIARLSSPTVTALQDDDGEEEEEDGEDDDDNTVEEVNRLRTCRRLERLPSYDVPMMRHSLMRGCEDLFCEKGPRVFNSKDFNKVEKVQQSC
eukprot:scaffold23485_cov35-Attheya_sp.AAC.2